MDEDISVLKKMEEMRKKRSRTFDSVFNKKNIDKDEMEEFLLGE